MNYSIFYTPEADKVISKWKKSNPILYKKLQKIVLDIAEHPRFGLGHPEPLVGGGDTTYSRHISAHDCIIYVIRDEVVTVVVIKVQGHYEDK